MCGRFARVTELEAVRRLLGFETADLIELHPRYNVAPTQDVAAVRLGDGRRSLVMLRWGLVPSWAKEAKIAHSLINARSETVAEKPAFRSAFKARRCLIPARRRTAGRAERYCARPRIATRPVVSGPVRRVMLQPDPRARSLDMPRTIRDGEKRDTRSPRHFCPGPVCLSR
jgi:hypothetical protein